MLESEYEELRTLQPEYARRWTTFLENWAAKKGYPEEFSSWGLWRWRALPPKADAALFSPAPPDS